MIVDKLGRAEFIKLFFGFFATLWAAVASYPVLRYLTAAARLQEKNSTNQITSLMVGSVDDFIPGSSKNFRFGNIPALLVRDEAGEFFAYNAICTHLGCTVQFSDESSKIFCACHGGQFDPRSGKNVAGPPPKPLKKLNVNIEEGNVIVSRA